jgi:ABC-type nickel/cobalt efflux system permease component RcnA/ABC-type uncharacterized transport system substrate-binding protein
MRRLLLAAFLALVSSFAASAHPHVWIDAEITPLTSAEGLTGLRVRWSFDPLSTANLMFSFDRDRNNRLSEGERAQLFEESFRTLNEGGYFLRAEAGGEPLSIGQARDFKVRGDEWELIYEFELPISHSWNDKDQVEFFFFDERYYIDFQTEPARETFLRGLETLAARPDSRRLQTQGWGSYDIPSVVVYAPGAAPDDAEDRIGLAEWGLGLGGFLQDWGRSLRARITDLVAGVRSGGGTWTLVVAFILAIAFGAVHVAGPGHGKIFTVSYFASREGSLREALAYSGLVNLLDSLSAVALVALGYGLLASLLPIGRDGSTRLVQIVSYGLVASLGIVHLLSHLLHRKHDHDHQHGHGHGEKRAVRPWMLAMSVGLIPCPVTTLLLVFGVATSSIPLMLFMVLGVSLGGFVTMSILALLVMRGRRALFARLHGRSFTRVAGVLEFAGSAVIIGVALGLFASVL